MGEATERWSVVGGDLVLIPAAPGRLLATAALSGAQRRSIWIKAVPGGGLKGGAATLQWSQETSESPAALGHLLWRRNKVAADTGRIQESRPLIGRRRAEKSSRKKNPPPAATTSSFFFFFSLHPHFSIYYSCSFWSQEGKKQKREATSSP